MDHVNSRLGRVALITVGFRILLPIKCPFDIGCGDHVEDDPADRYVVASVFLHELSGTCEHALGFDTGIHGF